MNSFNKKYNKSLYITLLLLGLTLVFLLKNNELPQLFHVLKNVNPQYILLGILGMGGFFLCQALCVKTLLRSFGYRAKLIECTRYSLIDFYFSAITPGAMGGQPSEIYYMQQDGIKVGSSSLAMLLFNMVYHLAVLVVAGIAILAGGMDIIHSMGKLKLFFYYGIAAQLLLVLGFFVLVFSKNLAPKIMERSIKVLAKLRIIKNRQAALDRGYHHIGEYREGASYIKASPGILVKLLLIGIIHITLLYSTPYWVYKAIGLSGHSYISILAIQSALTLAIESLPIPGGLGVMEGGFLTIYGSVFGRANVLAALLITRGISYYASLGVGGLVTALTKGRKIPKMAKE